MILHRDDRAFAVPAPLNREPQVSVTNRVKGATWRGEGWRIPPVSDASTVCCCFFSSVPIVFSLSMYIQHASLTLWERSITILTLKWVDLSAYLRYWIVRAHNTLFRTVSWRRCQRQSLSLSAPWYEHGLSLWFNSTVKLGTLYVCQHIANVSLTAGDLSERIYVLQSKSLWSLSKVIMTRQPFVRL